jgi:hypothetical protein
LRMKIATKRNADKGTWTGTHSDLLNICGSLDTHRELLASDDAYKENHEAFMAKHYAEQDTIKKAEHDRLTQYIGDRHERLVLAGARDADELDDEWLCLLDKNENRFVVYEEINSFFFGSI